MRLEVKAENISPEDLDLQTESFTRRLSAYPVEAVLKAIRRWPDENRFWPAWQELKAEVDSCIETSRVLLEGPKTEFARISPTCECWVCKLERERAE